MARIVCLANSFKRGGRCVAGIDLSTNQWIRPIGDGHEGAIGGERIINGAEPELLDILDIPTGPAAVDHGCQPENVVLESGRWRKLGEMSIQDVANFVEDTQRFLLHNRTDRVLPSEFEDNIPQHSWKSLQLIRVHNVLIQKNPWRKLECSFRYNGILYSLKVTCPNAEKYINERGDFLFTISMGAPFARKPEDPLYCWKMIAGVIRLDDGDADIPF